MQTSLMDRLIEAEKIYGKSDFWGFLLNHSELDKKPIEERIRIFKEGVSQKVGGGDISFLFRDKPALKFFKSYILPSYSNGIKIASVGCGRGKEPYSILLDNWEQRRKLWIVGYDSDAELIE